MSIKSNFLKTVVFMTVMLSMGCTKSSQAEVTIDHCGGEVNLQQGEILVVKLESQMTAGYLWQNEQLTDGVLKAIGEPTIERKPSDLDGGSETQVFRFKASNQGETTLSFRYQHPWKTETPPLRSCSISVTVKSDG